MNFMFPYSRALWLGRSVVITADIRKYGGQLNGWLYRGAELGGEKKSKWASRFNFSLINRVLTALIAVMDGSNRENARGQIFGTSKNVLF